MNQLELSSRTVVDWINFTREVLYNDCIVNKTPNGGPGKTVEIDESLFDRRKYNRCRYYTSQWTFGGIERELKQCF